MSRGIALVVDDNADIRTLIKQALELEGFSVHEAENGAVAQRKIDGGLNPCVVLLDLMMPVMDGREFLNLKNSRTEWNDLKIVVVSALTATHDQLPGALAVLRKPVDIEAMMNIVEECCCRPA
jgi:two-component system, chemotaxis family, chemotaxis protein CheY